MNHPVLTSGWNLVHLDEVPARPWLNGGGVTCELLAWPHANDWLWRFSVAEVAQDGPFSRLEGVHRWFVVLNGNGVRLQLEGEVQELRTDSAPFPFDGGALANCQLIDGPTQDFNLMLRRGTARVHRVSGSPRYALEGVSLAAIYTGSLPATAVVGTHTQEFGPHTLAWRLSGNDAAVTLLGEGALWMEIRQ